MVRSWCLHRLRNEESEMSNIKEFYHRDFCVKLGEPYSFSDIYDMTVRKGVYKNVKELKRDLEHKGKFFTESYQKNRGKFRYDVEVDYNEDLNWYVINDIMESEIENI